MKTPDPASFASRLGKVIEYYKMRDPDYTQKDFATRWGVDTRNVQYYLAGRPPALAQIGMLADAFPEINMDWLITGKGNMLKYSNELRHYVGNVQEGGGARYDSTANLVDVAKKLTEGWELLTENFPKMRELIAKELA